MIILTLQSTKAVLFRAVSQGLGQYLSLSRWAISTVDRTECQSASVTATCLTRFQSCEPDSSLTSTLHGEMDDPSGDFFAESRITLEGAFLL